VHQGKIPAENPPIRSAGSGDFCVPGKGPARGPPDGKGPGMVRNCPIWNRAPEALLFYLVADDAGLPARDAMMHL